MTDHGSKLWLIKRLLTLLSLVAFFIPSYAIALPSEPVVILDVPSPLLVEDFRYGPEESSVTHRKEITLTDSILCNCYKYVKSFYPDLPSMREIINNVSDTFGEVAVFNYRGVYHFAIVENMGSGTFTISETNYDSCTKGSREIHFSDPALLGFYTPS